MPMQNHSTSFGASMDATLTKSKDNLYVADVGENVSTYAIKKW